MAYNASIPVCLYTGGVRARPLLRRVPALPVRQRQRGRAAAAQPLRRPAARAPPPRALRRRHRCAL